MKRSIIFVLLACLLFPGMTWAGGQKESVSDSAEASSSEEKTLSLLLEASTPKEGFQAVAEAAKKDLGISIDIEYRPSGGEGDNVVKTRLASGSMDDICSYNSGALLQPLDPEEYFMDLSDQPFTDRLDDTFRQGVTVNGKVFGIPFSSSQVGGWLYNKKVFSKLGLSVPQTWE